MSKATVKPSLFVCGLILAYEIGCSADSYVVATRSAANSGGVVVDSGSVVVDSGDGGQRSVLGRDGGITADAGKISKYFEDKTGKTNPAGLPDADVKKLIAGGPVGKLRWLYPYHETVFPGGTLAPSFMWDGDPATEAIYLRVKSNNFEYKTVTEPRFALASTITLGQVSDGVAKRQPQFKIPQDIWDIACQLTEGKADPFSIELSTLVNGTVAGPIRSQFYIAPGSVRGSVYYTRHGEVPGLTSGSVSSNGALMLIPPRESARPLLQDYKGVCTGCHAISANGSRLIAQNYGGVPTIPNEGYSFQLDPVKGPTEPISINGDNAELVALYPDGSKYLAQSQSPMGCWMFWNSAKLMGGVLYTNTEATLYNATTGKVVVNTNIPPGAIMPMFSPDGTRLVFNDYQNIVDMGFTLAVMAYDTATDKATDYKVLRREPDSGSTHPAWPNFLPDNKAVVFERTDSPDFCGTAAEQFSSMATATDEPVSVSGPLSDLYIIDVTDGSLTLLAKAMGFNTPDDYKSENTFFPFAANDLHHNYNVTVSPVASGGYFWVFFDSPRNYGNLGMTRAIWGAAIDIQPDGHYTSDPSHPPFYLPGQEYRSSNHRAVAVLNPCKNVGFPCATGIDCCRGYCSASSGGVCTPPYQGCSNRDERCTTAADCCEPGNICINGFCAYVPLL
jgi:hypothetical protein